MVRQLRKCAWLLLLTCAAGCGDTIDFVQRDYCNVQHEIIDKMTNIVDDATAKQFNDAYKGRYKDKEDVVDARREKIENNLFAQSDRDNHRARLIALAEKDLKGQYDSLDSRFRVAQNRLRRIIVKLVEEQAAAAKSSNKSFSIRSDDVCPNLTNLEKGSKFTKGDNSMMGGGMMMMQPMMMQPGAAMPGGPAPGGQQAAAAPKVDPRANENFSFVLAYTFTGDAANPWIETTREWQVGRTKITLPPINGVEILPLQASQ